MDAKKSSGQGWSLISDGSRKAEPTIQKENRWNILVEKRPGGRQVTLVKNPSISIGDHQSFLKKLQVVCGTGGALKVGGFELQGDHRDKVAAFCEGLTGQSPPVRAI